jgi:membrane protein implicated in regulation of membrane protease activity
MTQFFSTLSPIEVFYAACAILGGTMFLIRTVLFFAGADTHADSDLGVDMAHGDADASFRVLSIQSLSAFFMMFGLVALAATRQSMLPTGIALAAGAIAGALTVWIIGKIFTGMKRLQSDGTLHVANAIGHEGSVYLTIHATTAGKVQIAVQGRLSEFEAVSEDKSEIKTGERVTVTRVLDNGSLVVKKC